MNRDFKGVWIPREIWLCNELSLLDKALYAEIDSLDNELHCVASNDYFADFFNVGVATITRSISKLKSLGYIEAELTDGRHRVIKVVRRESNQNDETDSSKRLANNIYNNIDINNTKVLFNTTTSAKKKNLYEKCTDMILDYTNDTLLRNELFGYRDMLLEITSANNKPLYANVFKGKLNSLGALSMDIDTQISIVQQSIKNGWINFYELKQQTKSYKDPMNESGVVQSVRCNEEGGIVF